MILICHHSKKDKVKIEVKSLTPVHFSEDIGYWKLGVIGYSQEKDTLIGGMVYEKDENLLGYVSAGDIIDVEIKETRSGNTFKINIYPVKQKKNKIVNNIEDPF